jgi:hypothetical protein
MGRKSRISVSLSAGVVEGFEGRRGLVERSTFYESYNRGSLDLELGLNKHMEIIWSKRQAARAAISTKNPMKRELKA